MPTYDRSWLIDESIGTLRRTLIEEALVVSLVIIVFLFHVRSLKIVTSARCRGVSSFTEGRQGCSRAPVVRPACSDDCCLPLRLLG